MPRRKHSETECYVFQQENQTTAVIYAERDRLLMRSFLRQLAADPKIREHASFRDFLTSDPFEPSYADFVDAEKRVKSEEARKRGMYEAKEAAEQKLQQMERELFAFRDDFVTEGGLDRIIKILSEIDRFDELPDYVKCVFDWVRLK